MTVCVHACVVSQQCSGRGSEYFRYMSWPQQQQLAAQRPICSCTPHPDYAQYAALHTTELNTVLDLWGYLLFNLRTPERETNLEANI